MEGLKREFTIPFYITAVKGMKNHRFHTSSYMHLNERVLFRLRKWGSIRSIKFSESNCEVELEV